MIFGRVFCSQIRVMEWRGECDFNLQNNLDVWRVYIPDFVDKIEDNLHLLEESEIAKSESFLQEADRNRYLIGKIYLKKIIANYLKIAPEDVRFKLSEFNKPVLSSNHSLKFNISHSGDYLIIGLSNKWWVGVDVELVDTKIDLYNLIYNSMTSVEVSSILNSGSPREVFYKHWTRKEALLKGLGLGLTDRIQDINCCDGLNFVPSDLSGFASTWEIRNFVMKENYMVSIAYDAAVRVIRFYEMVKN